MTTLAPTLTSRAFPNVNQIVRDIVLILLGAALVALLAQVSILLPFTPVPLTGQTLGILLVGASLGSTRGGLSLLTYLASGAVGLPVFAGGKSGVALMGPTGGYLIGFVLAAYVIGLLADRGLERSFRTSLVPFLVGTVIIYALGAGWLAFFVGGLEAAVVKGVLPFLIGDAIKLVLAGLILPTAWKFVK